MTGSSHQDCDHQVRDYQGVKERMADESKTGILGHLPPLPRPALNNSVIGMEQAYRQRKGLSC